MSEVEPKILLAERARLASLKRSAQDSRSLFDTFLLQSDHLLRFTDDLLRRADEIGFPVPPTISVTPEPSHGRRVEARPAARERNAKPRPTADPGARRTAPSVQRVVDLTDAPSPAPPPPSPSVLSARTAPIVVVIGPVDRMGEIEDLTIDLETVPEIDVHFRLFRAGAYRIDASCSDIDGFTDRLRTRRDVLSVDRQGPMVHVLPAPVTL